MADTVSTLSTTLQAQIAGAGPSASTMTQLFQALIAGVVPMLASRIARRVGILNTSTGSQWNMLIGGCSPGDVARNFLECREVENLYGNLQTFSANIARVNDPMVLNQRDGGASVTSWANALVAFAASYEAFELETLPA